MSVVFALGLVIFLIPLILVIQNVYNRQTFIHKFSTGEFFSEYQEKYQSWAFETNHIKKYPFLYLIIFFFDFLLLISKIEWYAQKNAPLQLLWSNVIRCNGNWITSLNQMKIGKGSQSAEARLQTPDSRLQTPVYLPQTLFIVYF